MFPVIASDERVTTHMLAYTWATVLTSFALIPVTSWIYLVVAVGAGAWFIYMVTKLLKLAREPHPDDVADALAIAICTTHCMNSFAWRNRL